MSGERGLTSSLSDPELGLERLGRFGTVRLSSAPESSASESDSEPDSAVLSKSTSSESICASFNPPLFPRL